jgi:hypothetical protein
MKQVGVDLSQIGPGFVLSKLARPGNHFSDVKGNFGGQSQVLTTGLYQRKAGHAQSPEGAPEIGRSPLLGQIEPQRSGDEDPGERPFVERDECHQPLNAERNYQFFLTMVHLKTTDEDETCSRIWLRLHGVGFPPGSSHWCGHVPPNRCI